MRQGHTVNHVSHTQSNRATHSLSARCETGHFTLQNRPFYVAKWAVLQCETGRIAITSEAHGPYISAPAASPEQAVGQMPDGCKRMMPQHARASIAHHSAHMLTHGRLVAVYGTILASGFAVAETTMIETREGIEEQFAALLTQLA